MKKTMQNLIPGSNNGISCENQRARITPLLNSHPVENCQVKCRQNWNLGAGTGWSWVLIAHMCLAPGHCPPPNFSPNYHQPQTFLQLKLTFERPTKQKLVCLMLLESKLDRTLKTIITLVVENIGSLRWSELECPPTLIQWQNFLQ